MNVIYLLIFMYKMHRKDITKQKKKGKEKQLCGKIKQLKYANCPTITD